MSNEYANGGFTGFGPAQTTELKPGEYFIPARLNRDDYAEALENINMPQA